MKTPKSEHMALIRDLVRGANEANEKDIGLFSLLSRIESETKEGETFIHEQMERAVRTNRPHPVAPLSRYIE